MARPLRPRWIDLIREATAEVLTRPARSAFTALGTAVGVAVLVAVVGAGQTASAQVTASFDRIAFRRLVAEVSGADGSPNTPFGPADIRAVSRVDGVRRAGVLNATQRGPTAIRVRWSQGETGGASVRVFGASPTTFTATGTHLAQGRAFDQGHESRSDRVVVLGSAAARLMGVPDLVTRPTVFIGTEPFTVIGLIDRTDGFPDLLSSAVIPQSTLTAFWSTEVVTSSRLVVETKPGAAEVVAGQIAVAARPQAPESVQVGSPEAPTLLRESIDRDLRSLLLALTVISLAIGLLGIANATLASVLQRIPEFGLRRSLGASRSHNALQVVIESTILGLAGGLVGASTGVLVTTIIASGRGWTPTLDLRLLPAAVALAGVVGLAAGLVPALRASSVQPDEALRS